MDQQRQSDNNLIAIPGIIHTGILIILTAFICIPSRCVAQQRIPESFTQDFSVSDFHDHLASVSELSWPNQTSELRVKSAISIDRHHRNSVMTSDIMPLSSPEFKYRNKPSMTPLQAIGAIMLGVTKQIIYPYSTNMPDL